MLSEKSNEMGRYDEVFCIQPSLWSGVILTICLKTVWKNTGAHTFLYYFEKKGETTGLNTCRSSLFIPSNQQLFEEFRLAMREYISFPTVGQQNTDLSERKKDDGRALCGIFRLIVCPITAK